MLSRQVGLAELQPKLLTWLQKKMPEAKNLAIANLERSGAGISNETFLFKLSWQDHGKPKSEGMVLRCAPRSSPVYPDYDLSLQFRVMKALHGSKVPVSKVHWLEQDERVLGTAFYIMGKIEGVSRRSSLPTIRSASTSSPHQRNGPGCGGQPLRL